MNYPKALWLILFLGLLVEGIYVAGMARRHSRVLAMLESFSAEESVSRQLPAQTAHRAENREQERLLHRLKSAQEAVRILTEEREVWQRFKTNYEKIQNPPEEMSLEEFRKTQPEEYEKLRCEIARILRYAAAKKRLRQEYLARLDFSVLTEEERQALISTMEEVAQAEDFLLEGGEGELKLYYKTGRKSFGDRRQWLREADVVNLAAMADWKHAGGSEHFATVMRALFLHDSSPMNVQPQSPQAIRGTTTVSIAVPQASEGMRLMNVRVETGWSPE